VLNLLPNPFVIPVGIVIGILVSAPVGPVNILCIQRAIQRGFLGGVAAGIGAMLGDGLIAFFAALGVGAISGAVQAYRAAIQVIGGMALIAFGVTLYRTSPHFEPVHEAGNAARSLMDHAWDVPKTFFLTITNPAAVLGLFAIFGGISTFVEVRGRIDAMALVAATMAGSLAWWVGLSYFIGRIRHRLSDAAFARINRVAGVALIAFGLLLVGEIVLQHTGAIRT
jgi:threonine/homoserine/homoserine lactone efflux protein